MLLTTGDQLGSYEILALIGKGGVGEVYHARDSRLKRDVAIKISAAPFSESFTREARAVAALSHANICRLYDVGPDYLVMEYVEGQDLRGPIYIDKALPIIHQLIDAIEAAHEKNIVHGDLRPANIKITADGVVKIMHFGFATTPETELASEGDPENPLAALVHHSSGAPKTRTPPQTTGYMSPEQARGQTPDKRSDIWSFGVILFEVLTDKRLFPGSAPAEILKAILNKEPDISAAPPRVRGLLGWCLTKDRKRRLASISDARKLLDAEITPAPIAVKASPIGKHPLVLALGAIALVLLLFVFWGRPAAVPGVAARLGIPMPAGQEITDYPAISPDGRTVAYITRTGVDNPQLYLRDLNSFDAHAVAASGGAQKPFFSPDGKWIAFFAQGQLLKADVSGGAPIHIADATSPYGGTWTDDNNIVYVASLGSGLLRVPSGGGNPETLAKPDGAKNGYGYFFPQALPGGHSVLFTVWGQAPGSAVLSLDSHRWEMAMPAKSGAAFFEHVAGRSTGHILIVDDTAGIRAAPFDAAHSGHTAPEDAPVLPGVYSSETDQRAWLAVSNNGSAVYAPGNPAKRSLVWVDQDGKVEPLPKAQDMYAEAVLSPDGSKAVVRHGFDLWVHDLLRGTRSRLTSGDPINLQPVWSLDGTRIIFASNRGGDWDIYSQLADASEPATALLKLPDDQFPLSFLSDGTLLYSEVHPKTGNDLWTLSPDGKTTPLRVTPFNEMDGQFSPGAEGAAHWVAYSSDESGKNEIYVQSYPSGANRVQVSSGGGIMPHWSRDGHELFYVTDDAFVAVTMRPDGTAGSVRKLFDRSNFLIQFRGFDVSAGSRFLMIQRDPGSVPRQLNVILNWSDELDRLVPGR